MPKLSKTKSITGDGSIKESSPDKQDETLNTRNSDGTFRKGVSGNPNGRPKGNSAIERFRDNPKAQSVIDKLFAVADTLNDTNPHKDAIASAKLIIERIIPSLKATEMKVDTDNDKGFVLLPTPEEDDE